MLKRAEKSLSNEVARLKVVLEDSIKKAGHFETDFTFGRKEMRRGATHPSDLVMTRKVDFVKEDYYKIKALYLTQFEDASELSTFFSQTMHRASTFIDTANYVGKRGSWTFGDYKDKDAQEIEKVLEKINSGIAVGDVLTYMDKQRDELELSGALDLSNSIKNCKRTRRFTDESGELDIDRVLSGDENYWMENKRDGKQEFLRIVINLSLSAGNDSNVHAKLLASGLVTAEILEKMGYGIEIYVAFSGTLSRCERAWMVKLKDCTEHMDEQRIASVGCSLVQRLISFSIQKYFYDVTGHQCMETSDEMIDFMGADIYMGQQWTKEGGQIELIKKAVLKIAEGR